MRPVSIINNFIRKLLEIEHFAFNISFNIPNYFKLIKRQKIHLKTNKIVFKAGILVAFWGERLYASCSDI